MPSKMTRDERSAYMRDYRARKKPSDGVGAVQSAPPASTPAGPPTGSVTPFDEVRHGPLVLPSFLAAPDDDCLVCGHDQQAYHLVGACTYPVGRRQSCGCPAFAAAF